jgi:hypothetical protein
MSPLGARVARRRFPEGTRRKVKLKLFAQSSLGADAVAIAYDQHPYHQLGINRRSTNLAIEWCQLLAKLKQYPGHDRIDQAQKMARRYAPVPLRFTNVHTLNLSNWDGTAEHDALQTLVGHLAEATGKPSDSGA